MYDVSGLPGLETAAGLLPPNPDCFFLLKRAPQPAFCDAVLGFTGYAERTSGHFRQIQAAPLAVPLIISFSSFFTIALGRAPEQDERYACFTSGLYAGPAVIDSFGASACIQVDFTPTGARRFFGVPMHELAARMIVLDDILGPLAWRLRERLGEEPDWNRRLSIVEGIVYRRLLECPAPDRQTAIALRRIAISHGSASMAGLAAELDCSRKHLVEMFHRNVGIAPKTYARMVRFHRVRQLVMSSGRAMADIALECGFSDQAHMSRDFLEFSGETPSRWKHRVS
ncbi:helix-turn-helix domain-containing protein [Nitratireductor rhodophyticola]|uniref:AraC family transcriptional regulator n=1 Tax=Nitratireductor rhodophyticola TaxID=2854036 RepID=UPI00300A6DDE